MNTLYLECNSGISGDMTVAALLDLGADQKVLMDGLDSLGVEGYSIAISKVEKSGITACDFDVKLDSEEHHHHHEEHDHDHSHGDSHTHGHDHHHDHPHNHDHGHDHKHNHSHSHDEGHGHSHSHGEGGDHVHRNVLDINTIIDDSAITPRAKELSKKIFHVIAQAEAKVHGLPVEEVHFHEVGAVDSIVDIVAAAICIDNLNITRVYCSPLREGTGTIRCQHGVIPVPAPATLEIVRARGIPLVITKNKGEMVTPTGAGIVAALADSFEIPDSFSVKGVGYGAGKRNFATTANLLRACLVEENAAPSRDTVLKLECNLDDMTGEALGHVLLKLFREGALDAWFTPIYMKKNRPAQLLSVLIRPHDRDRFLDLLFAHTTTAGVRESLHSRHTMARRQVTVDTPYGQVEAKELTWGATRKVQVEYESARALSDATNIPVNLILPSAYSKE